MTQAVPALRMPEPAPDPWHGVNVLPVSQKGADLITDQTAAIAQVACALKVPTLPPLNLKGAYVRGLDVDVYTAGSFSAMCVKHENCSAL